MEMTLDKFWTEVKNEYPQIENKIIGNPHAIFHILPV